MPTVSQGDRDLCNRIYIAATVDASYKNTGCKNPSSIYRIICILFHWIFSGYKNIPCLL